jgi:hypothetical protein
MPLIYKLYDELDCYVGSTTSTLNERLSKHKNSRNCKSVVILDRNNFTIELIEEVETNDRYEREQYWIDKLSTLNQHNCYWKNVKERKDKYEKEFKKKWYLENKDRIVDEKKNYYQENKKYIMEKAKQNYETNRAKLHEKFTCECGGKYTYHHKTHHLKTKKHLAYICEKEKTNITLEKNEMIITHQ